ncbi:phospholipase A2 inhibitor and Ly6/PLAUR domain-containing protein-like [Sphaerodactylus townsendi]|nr:phospholipase A2 inhibitor and Ly6/PLAUR domain-containing protein-like [Sphaerodactylus townsendi]
MTIPGTLFLFAILFAIARTGFPIQCEVSLRVTTRNQRSTSLRNCGPEFDTCQSLVIEATRFGKTVRTVKKFCSTKASCVPGAVFMHVEKGLKETGHNLCCSTNGCNTVVPPVPVWNETPNGLWCPSCSVQHPDKCEKETTRCKGLENQCFKRTIGNNVHMGCATEAFCANSAHARITITNTQGVQMSRHEIECSRAPQM